MTVAELLARVSSKEITEWMLFFELEPFGAEAEFLGHAITASTIANVNRGKGRARKVEDFMPKFSRQKEQTVDDMINFAAAMTHALGGKDERE